MLIEWMCVAGICYYGQINPIISVREVATYTIVPPCVEEQPSLKACEPQQ